MKDSTDYKTIIAEIVEATSAISDEKLKEIAFQKLLEHSLNPIPTITATKHEGITKSTTGKSRKTKNNRQTVASIREGSVRDEVKKTFSDVIPNMPGLKPLRELKQKWEKYLWVLVVAKEKGIEAMTNAEIAYVLSEKFSVGVTEKQVNNLTFKAESGHVQKRDLGGVRAWKVLIDGINLIKIDQTSNEQTSQS